MGRSVSLLMCNFVSKLVRLLDFFNDNRYLTRPERLIKIISTRYFLVIKVINKYLVDMILINYFRSGIYYKS
jgi:hypothetical protein